LYLAREFSQIQIVFLFFGDISDPVPLLELTIGLQTKAARMQDVDLEVKQLRETLAEYNEEFRQVRNQGKKNQHFLFLFFFFGSVLFEFFYGDAYCVCSFYRYRENNNKTEFLDTKQNRKNLFSLFCLFFIASSSSRGR
jgi:hypothetical protein